MLHCIGVIKQPIRSDLFNAELFNKPIKNDPDPCRYEELNGKNQALNVKRTRVKNKTNF